MMRQDPCDLMPEAISDIENLPDFTYKCLKNETILKSIFKLNQNKLRKLNGTNFYRNCLSYAYK